MYVPNIRMSLQIDDSENAMNGTKGKHKGVLDHNPAASRGCGLHGFPKYIPKYLYLRQK